MALTALFNILTVFYVFRSLQLGVSIWRNWSDLLQPPFSPRQKQMAEQASFFIAVPIGVFIHELLHAVPVWAFGGEVVEFAYRVFWGYVRPDRAFSDPQQWFISLAGTLGNLAFGLLLWLVLRRAKAASLRYFALRAFRFQVYFALIYYPLFTLVLPIGDWRVIYDFSATPALSGVTAVFHAFLLLAFWYGDRTGWFEMPAFRSQTEADAYQTLVQQTAVVYENPQPQLRLVDALRRGGAVRRAQRQLDEVLAAHPNVGVAHLQKALLNNNGRDQLSPSAARSVERALELGMDDSRQTAVAYRLLGQFHLDRNQLAEAQAQLDQAIALTAAPNAAPPLFRADLFHLRAQVHRRQQAFAQAEEDARQAVALAQAAGDEPAVQRYQSEITTIERHAQR